MPRERQRARRFALALEGAEVHDPLLAPMVRLAAVLGAAAAPTPTEQFRRALRQRLLAVPAVSSAIPAGASVTAGASRPAPWRRHLLAAGTVLAVTTGGAAATAVASTGALPGDYPLYDVKRTVEGVQLALATSEQAKGERHLQIAATRLEEVAGLLDEAGPRPANPVVIQELRKTLSSMATSTELGSEQLFAAYRRTSDPAVLVPLDGFLREQARDLAILRPQLPAELSSGSSALQNTFDRIAAQLAALTGASSAPLQKDGPSLPSRNDLPHGQRGDRPLPALPGRQPAGAASGAASGLADQTGLVGLDVNTSRDSLPGASAQLGSDSTDLPVPLPNASVGTNAPEEPTADLLGELPAPRVGVDAPLPGQLGGLRK